MEPVFLLHRKPYSNSSLLLECFSEHHGRFPIIAKGCGGRSGNAASLQPFVSLLMEWRGRGEVKTLANFDATRTIRLKGKTLYCGFYLNELLMRLIGRNDPHEELFHRYSETLLGLESQQDPEPTLREFEVNLLNELGYGMIFDQDVENNVQIDPDRYYHYQVERGPVLAKKDGENCVRGSTLLALSGARKLDSVGRREARELIRRVLSHYLGDRPLKSRELFKTYLQG